MIIEGKLIQMSSGEYTGLFTRREYIKIGDTRFQGLLITNYLDEVLSEYLGKSVTLSVCRVFFFANIIVAFKGSVGEVNKMQNGKIFVLFFFVYLLSLIIGMCALVIAQVFQTSLGLFLSSVIGGVAWVLLALAPTPALRRLLRSRNAIS